MKFGLPQLSADQRRYFVVETVASILINMVLNAGAAWASVGASGSVQMWALEGIAFGLLVQAFLIGSLTVLITEPIAGARLRAGKVDPIPRTDGGLIAALPGNLLLRSVLFGLALAVVTGLPLIAALAAGGVERLETGPFVVLKTGYSALAALLTAPLAVQASLARA